jgi:hypothetical protein
MPIPIYGETVLVVEHKGETILASTCELSLQMNPKIKPVLKTDPVPVHEPPGARISPRSHRIVPARDLTDN